jgi:hypothetical protein
MMTEAPDFHALIEAAFPPIAVPRDEPLPSMLDAYGPAAMRLKSRRDLFKIHDGGRRMLGDRTAGGGDLKLVKKEN